MSEKMEIGSMLSRLLLSLAFFCSIGAVQAESVVSPEEKLCREISPLGCLSHLGVRNFTELDRMAMLMSVAQWHIDQGTLEQADDFLSMLIQLDKYNSRAHHLLGDVRYRMALAGQQKADKFSAEMSELYFRAAASSYREATQLDPGDAEGYIGFIRSAGQVGNCTAAKSAIAAYEAHADNTDDIASIEAAFRERCLD